MNIRDYIENCPVHWRNSGFIENNPMFMMGTRFAQKEVLGLWSNREEFGNFHVMFGVAKESIGKIHFANNIFNESVVYYWGDYCDNKMLKSKCHYHIGASPYFYGHLLNSREVDRKGTIFFLPRVDHRVDFDTSSSKFDEIKSLILNAPKPVTILSYLDKPQVWARMLATDNIKILSYDVGDVFWQLKINEVFLKHKYAYIPNICSDFFYSTISGCEAIYYDCKEIYKPIFSTDAIIPSYHPKDVTPTYLKFDEMLKNMFDGNGITEEQFYLSCKMLSVSSSECSEDLAVTMERLSATQQMLRYDIDTTDSFKRHFTPKYASKYRDAFKPQDEAEKLRKQFVEDFNSIKKIDYIDDIMNYL